MKYIHKLVKEICLEKNIDLSFVSKNYIMILKKGSKVRYIVGYKFALNDYSAAFLCDDKFATYEVLRHFAIPVAEYNIFFRNFKETELLQYASNYNYDVVLKNTVGTCGSDVYHLDKENILTMTYSLLQKCSSITLSPYYKIKYEYRTIILNDKVELFYKKCKKTIVGDGKSSIYELLSNLNLACIKEKEQLQRVLEKNERYEVEWRFNLSKGAHISLDVPVALKNQIQQIALEVAKVLNLKFGSIDIIELEDGQLLVLEVNSGVMMENFVDLEKDGYKKAKNIYAKAIEEMFK